jgi:two-component system NtrC family sensor kinase
MRLARKLILATLAGMALVLAVNATFRITRELELFAQDMIQDHAVLARTLAQAMTRVWEEKGRDEALSLLGQAGSPDGRFRVTWFEGQAPAPRTQARERRTTEVAITIRGQVVGTVELSESRLFERSYVRDTLIRTAWATLLAAGVAALIAIGLGVFMVGRPLAALAQKAKRIGTGDLTGPLNLKQQDEIGELGREIDAMCEHLVKARSALNGETEARLRAIEQLRHADRLATIGKLASGLAHELGTPLGVTLVRANMISSGSIGGQEAREAARIIGEQTERITSIVRQLLDFARGRTPRPPGEALRRQPVDIASLVQKTLSLVQPLADKRQLTLDCHAGPHLPKPTIDEGQIQQALLNLLVNAIQASDHPGKVTVEISVATTSAQADLGGREDDYLCLCVADQGVGIPQEILPHIFEPFFSTKGVGEGTGLGLSVASPAAAAASPSIFLVPSLNRSGRRVVFKARFVRATVVKRKQFLYAAHGFPWVNTWGVRFSDPQKTAGGCLDEHFFAAKAS